MTRSSTRRRWDSARMVCALASRPSVAGSTRVPCTRARGYRALHAARMASMKSPPSAPPPRSAAIGEPAVPPDDEREGPAAPLWVWWGMLTWRSRMSSPSTMEWESAHSMAAVDSRPGSATIMTSRGLAGAPPAPAPRPPPPPRPRSIRAMLLPPADDAACTHGTQPRRPGSLNWGSEKCAKGWRLRLPRMGGGLEGERRGARTPAAIS
jgi:hypothetical protein